MSLTESPLKMASVYYLLCSANITEHDVRSLLKDVELIDVNVQHNGLVVVRCNSSVTQQTLENCLQHRNIAVLPHIGERASVSVNSEWVKLVNQYKVKLHTLVKPGVTVRQSSSDVTLEGRKVDIDDALNNITAAVAQSYSSRYQLTNGDKQTDKQRDKQRDTQAVGSSSNGHSVTDSGDRTNRQTVVTNGSLSPDSPPNHIDDHFTAATAAAIIAGQNSRLSSTDVDINNSRSDPAHQSTSLGVNDSRKQVSSAVDLTVAMDYGRPSQQPVDSTRNSADVVTPVDRLVQFEIDEYIWRFVGFRFPDHCQLWNNKLLPTIDNTQRVVVLRGSKQDKTDFTDFYHKYELSNVVREIKRPTADIDQLVKVLISQSGEQRKNVLVEFSKTGEVEFIGKSVDVDKLVDWLRVEMRRYNEQKVNSARDAKDVSTSLNVSGASGKDSRSVVNGVGTGRNTGAGGGGDGGTHGSGVTVPVLSASAGGKTADTVSNASPVSAVSLPLPAAAAVSPQFTVSASSPDRLQFTTPFSRLNVEVCRGNLTRQRTEVIVNPSNSHLHHVGGAAKAIADAAGYDLVKECDTYIRVNKSLRVTQVMHTTAGRLPRPINYVIHACGPDVKRYPDMKQCSQLLLETFYNCLVYANDNLLVQSIALPAISSGTFGVPFDVVSDAAFSALMEFDKNLSTTSVKKRHITDIKFVNITADVTTTLINTFTSHITYMLSQNQQANTAAGRTVVPAAVAAAVKSPVLSAGRRTPDDSDADDSSVRQCGPRLAPKVGSEDHSVCCVCMKKVELRQLHIRGNCTHKCCSKCTNKRCTKCLSSAPAPRTKRYDEDHGINAPTKMTDYKTASSTPAAADDVPKFPFSRHRSGSLNRGVKEKSKSSLKDAATKVDVKPGDKQDSDSGDDTNGPSRLRRSNSLTTHNRKKLGTVDNCVICMDNMTDPKTLSCGHKFCKDCVERALKLAAKCPVCGHIFGQLKGDQPTGGTMRTKTSTDDLAGFRGCGSIIINYEIPTGFQQSNHPHPGRLFKGTRRTAYLPNNSEGQEVCSMLREAFNAGLVFTVGRSVTTGEEDVVVWNDIHHKTSKTGTYGYPDYTYLTRVKSELAAKGIVPPGNRAIVTATGGTVGGVTGGGTSDVSVKLTAHATHNSPSFTPSSSRNTTTGSSSSSRITSSTTTTTFTPATTTNSSSVVASSRPSHATVDVHRNDTTDNSYTMRPGEDVDAFLKRFRLTDTSSHATSSTRVTDPYPHHTASSALSSTLTSTLTSDPVSNYGNTSQPSFDPHTSSVGHSTSARNPDDYYSTHGTVSSLNPGPQSLPINYSSSQTRPQSSQAYQSNFQSNQPVDRTSARLQSSSGYQSDYSRYPSTGTHTTHSSNISARAVVSASGHNIYRDTKSPASAASSYLPRDLPASRYDSSSRDYISHSSHSSSRVGSNLQRTSSTRESRPRDRTPPYTKRK